MKILTDCMGLYEVLPRGYVAQYHSAEELASELRHNVYNAVICIWHGDETMRVIERLRSINHTIPILVLLNELWPSISVLATETKIIMAGADYLLPMTTDSYSIKLRLATCARRTHGHVEKVTLCSGNLAVDLRLREVRFQGTVIKLTKSQRVLFCDLSANVGTIRSRAELLQVIKEAKLSSLNSERSVDSAIARIRARLGRHSYTLAGQLKTIRGQGYLFADVR